MLGIRVYFCFSRTKEDYSKMSVRIVARFSDAAMAETAKIAISQVLKSAEAEVADLFKLQDGVANTADISKIYTQYGFVNDIGWQQEQPLIAHREELVWDIPEGLVLEEAQVLLAALGAQIIDVGIMETEESWRSAPHPAVGFPMDDEFDFSELDEEDLVRETLPIKKILH
jgi:hypothetical protein